MARLLQSSRERKLTLEVRSLNSKQLDLTVKVACFSEGEGTRYPEPALPPACPGQGRRIYHLPRTAGDAVSWTINKDLARKYHAELKELLKEFREDCPSGLAAGRCPDAGCCESGQEDIAEDDWEKIRAGLLVSSFKAG